jgi:hypothetical protein
MRVGALPLTFAAVVLAASLAAGDDSGSHLELVGLGGFVRGHDPAEVRVSQFEGSFLERLQGREVLGIECRVSQLWWHSFVGASYRRGRSSGFDKGMGSELDLRSDFLVICAGRDIRIAHGIISMALGYSYVIDRFSVRAINRPPETPTVRGSGCTVGARLSVPISGSVAALWDYQILVRPSTLESGALAIEGRYTILQGSVHHFILGGISFRVK